MKFRSITEA